MHNKITTLLLVILLCGFGVMQTQAQIYSPAVTGNETPDVSSNPVIEVTTGYVFGPVQAGQFTFDIHSIDPSTATGYDFQTNNSAQQLWMDPNNPDFLHAIFINSQVTSSHPDRTCLYYGSPDAGVTWFQIGQVPINADPTGGQDGRSGYPVIYGTSGAAAVIVNHNNSGGGDFRSKVYIDGSTFEYNFTEYDPLSVPYEPDSPIWPRMVVDGNDNVVFISSHSTGPDSSFTNVLNNSTGLFSGWQAYDGWRAEAYAISISESGDIIGMVYEGQDISNAEADIFYRESADGGLTWSTPVLVWDTDASNPDSMIGTWRGLDIEFLGEEPCAVFEIGLIASGEAYAPDFPSSIYFWSPNINGGVPQVIADSSNVPFYTNGLGNSDGALPMGKPSIGRSQMHDYLFVSFAATSGEIWTQTVDSTAYFAVHFMYSIDGGETWTDPEVITPSGPPVLDWRYPSIVPVSPVSTTDSDVITIHMTMQGDTIPGSNFGAAGTSMPLAVSAQYYHFTTDILVVGVDEDPVIVNEFILEQNYPNPFNPGTLIKYSLAERSNVTLKVYDVLGNEVAVLVNSKQEVGSYDVNFDASNLASGLYIYTLNTGSFTSSKKMMLLK